MPIDRSANAPALPWRNASLWLLAAAFLAVWLGTLGYRHLIPTDEGRYAEIAREMFTTGDWVTIRYNALKYFEKPPLQMWGTALAYTLFGIGDWQARLFTALSGIAGLVFTMLAAARWWGRRTAVITGLVLVSAPMWNVGAHFNSLDMGVAGCMTMALAALLLAQHPDATRSQQRNWMWVCWASMALAVLSKGLIGVVLPGFVLVVYTLVARDWVLWKRLHLVTGLIVFFAVGAPWFVLISARNPEFAWFFFVHEHFQRFTSTVHNRNAPLWYFVPLLLAGFLPWLAQLPGAVRLSFARSETAANGFRPTLMLGLWAILIFAFFSISDSKLPGYIFPIIPALAVLAALVLENTGERAWRWQLKAFLALAVVGLAASGYVATMSSDMYPNAVFSRFGLFLAVAFAAGAVFTWLALRFADKRFESLVAFACAWFLTFTTALLGHEAFGRSMSGIDLVPAVKPWLKPGVPFYAVERLDHTMPFYLGTPTTMVQQPDELAFGIEQEPTKWIPTTEAFVARWKEGGQAVAMMGPGTYDRLSAQGVPMIVIARDARRVIVRRN
ncbi:glycosyltransferase family 39 protein [Ralstonia insidiosa]|jgi:4-amino-4-deoxy-L-arabinose transferase-like glycosyltransferase|uniref:glycosyltransferase family 39 protein n=1 Tax=Ralstonia TaxID=48736 RepID=UPI000664A603|nr:glycosyltransferase family 39 protein [Ralstonia insidiosa]KMW48370.1 4-amino-4-deoxy-L-arabinose transferase [Ralstonia sp. MD27]MBX3770878.1 glycosyltransferase family 39 protein [Ralstonia pickettii]NOZ18650.1 glycosyltransferase family 39 protein [Betaproteobacteria bacterium]MBA9855035.1 glycosyltransferase family 39 protein [Ralstonia insidiosa]MBA9872102.1 glycosyltransferase family 39 protein [Ralstonia insidiosa]